MSDDKMRQEFEEWADKQCLSLTRINWKCGTVSEYAYTTTFDAWQVWQSAYQAGQKAEREAIFIEWENGETLACEVERLRAWNKRWRDVSAKLRLTVAGLADELAAAKAASVVPTDKESQKAFEKWLEYECWECHRSICKATWQAAIKWMKERGEG